MKIIKMKCEDIDYKVFTDITREYDSDIPWPELIGQFNYFLSSMGYVAPKCNEFVERAEE